MLLSAKKSDRIILNLVLFYLFYNMFNGIVRKVVYQKLNSLFSLIPYIGNGVIVIIILILILSKKTNYQNKIYQLGIGYYITVFILSLLKGPNLFTIIEGFKIIIIPFIFLYLLDKKNYKFGKKEYIIFRVKLLKLIKFFLICSVPLSMIQRKLGWEWTSKFYTGYSYYSTEHPIGIRIWTNNGVLRIPSTVGMSVVLALLSIFSILLLLMLSKTKKRYIFIALGFINIYLSNSRTYLIIALFILSYSILKKRWRQLLKCSSYLFLMTIPILIKYLSENFFSFNERLKFWGHLLRNNSIDVIFPINFFKYLPSSNLGVGIEKFMDNAFIYLSYSTGILGFLFFVYILFKDYKNNKVSEEIILFVILSGLTINFFQGLSLIYLYTILKLVYSHENNKKIKRIKI